MIPKVILHFSFKEDTGKSTLSATEAFLLGRMKERVLLIDMDTKATATKIFTKTFHLKNDFDKSIYRGFVQQDLNPEIIDVTENVSFIPGGWEINLLSKSMQKKFLHSDLLVLKKLINSLKRKFNYIIIDAPSSRDIISSNAIMASDFIFLILENQKLSYTFFSETVAHLSNLVSDFGGGFHVSGILLYLSRGNVTSESNQEFVEESKKKFGKSVLNNLLWYQERANSFNDKGIKTEEIWDERALKMYQSILNEELTRF
ncbi:ParA family protein [Oenococcus sp.]|uniref:ParA family protein n=1 Tax=Oenococcus sp. TaxID=1979414 RepID=UPI0039EA8D9F